MRKLVTGEKLKRLTPPPISKCAQHFGYVPQNWIPIVRTPDFRMPIAKMGFFLK